ncbi:MAG TPA: nitrous oxide reductase accessory protein NosL [Magnetospirillum sp.]|nr:nitrous oxide reductase accessory protein NosL [Magnetospirillum sp.]
MKRRQFLLAGTTIAAAATLAHTAVAAEGDGTPLQFIPKKPKDPNPLDNELEKYGKCPYCGMDRKQYHFSRHLIHYSDDLVDGTCSLHCAAISLSLNLDRMPKAIYAPDNGSGLEIKPLTNAETAFYVIGGDHKPVMSKTAKTSFASKVAAEAAKGTGEVVDFDRAMMLTHMGMAEDTMQIRKRREERRKAAAASAAQPQAEHQHGMKH